MKNEFGTLFHKHSLFVLHPKCCVCGIWNDVTELLFSFLYQSKNSHKEFQHMQKLTDNSFTSKISYHILFSLHKNIKHEKSLFCFI